MIDPCMVLLLAAVVAGVGFMAGLVYERDRNNRPPDEGQRQAGRDGGAA